MASPFLADAARGSSMLKWAGAGGANAASATSARAVVRRMIPSLVVLRSDRGPLCGEGYHTIFGIVIPGRGEGVRPKARAFVLDFRRRQKKNGGGRQPWLSAPREGGGRPTPLPSSPSTRGVTPAALGKGADHPRYESGLATNGSTITVKLAVPTAPRLSVTATVTV